MIKNLFRGSMDIIYNNLNNTRNSVNDHIRSFDSIDSATNGFGNASGFWRTVLELLLGLYFILSATTALLIHFSVVLIAWPCSLLVDLFMMTIAGINDQTKYHTPIEPVMEPTVETNKNLSKGKQNNEKTTTAN